VFALSSTFASLVDYEVFADWIFFALAGVALLVFRRTRPDAPRPYRSPLYPLLPLVFAIAGFGIVGNTFVTNLSGALIDLAIIAAGVPVYFAWQWWRRRRGSPARP
jgi:APA family basic amino acid/polyamine antiporter